ncbi:MAG: FG-GAP-like repeat-containing protein [Anaerolineales bacterium]
MNHVTRRGYVGLIGCGLLLAALAMTAPAVMGQGFDWLDPIMLENDWSPEETEDRTRSVAWGDIDGDGDLDLAVGGLAHDDPGRFAIQIYRNDDGRLNREPAQAFGEIDVLSVAWGDLDGDGDLDLVVGAAPHTDGEGGQNRAYRNVGGTLEMQPFWISEATDATHSVALGDIDGDGRLDLATGNCGASNVVYRNAGLTSEGRLRFEPLWTDAVSDTTTSIALGDVDGDGRLDLVVGNGDGEEYCAVPPGGLSMSNKLYLGSGDTLETAPVWESNEADLTRSVALGDVDGDGLLDLAVGNSDGEDRIYWNDGGSLESSASWVSMEAESTHAVAWGDVDGDGDVDLATGGPGPNYIYLNREAGMEITPTWMSDAMLLTSSIAWGDVDGDGDLDLAAGNDWEVNSLYIYENLNLDDEPVWEQPTDPDRYTTIAWGDVDGDGDMDLIAGSDLDASEVYLNVGGQLAPAPAWSKVLDGAQSLAWGDADGDGDLDLAVAQGESGCALYRNDGVTAGALTLTRVWTRPGYVTQAAWGDVDGDGDVDLAVVTGDLEIYHNIGGASFLEATPGWIWENEGLATAIAWGDVDGDGDLDLAVGFQNSPNRLFLNDEGALQRPAAWYADNRAWTTAIAWGDVDGDGDLDLAVGNASSPDVIYFNEGGALQTEAGWASKDRDHTTHLAWADVDGDGDVELTTVSWNTTRVYLNSGDGLPSAASWRLDGEPKVIAWGDVDGDGDVDLAVADTNGAQLYLNGKPAPPQHAGAPAYVAIRQANHADGYAAATMHDEGTIPFTYTLFDPTGASRHAVSGFYSLDGGGSWRPAVATSDTITQNLATDGREHVYTWDVLNSDVFGQSDNVVFRLVAAPLAPAAKSSTPDTYTYPRAIPGPYLRPNVSAQTHPLRVRGNQVRVISGTRGIGDALVYRLPAGQSTGATLYAGAAGVEVTTDEHGYLQGRGEIALGDSLIALAPASDAKAVACQRYTSADVPQTITDARPTVVTSTLTIADSAEIVDVNITLSGAHSYFGDLEFLLESPEGTSIHLMRPSCDSAEGNFDLSLDDDAEGGWPCPPNDGGVYRPSEPLAAFAGEISQGVWTLTVRDHARYDGGALDGWELEICTQAPAPYDLYYTSAPPTESGLDGHLVTERGVQTLEISRDNPLILFNLDVALEWDARQDTAFLEQLKFNLHKTAEILFDATHGQATLGALTIYHHRARWDSADIRIYASNALIPNADVGGIVAEDVTEVIKNNPYAIPSQSQPYTITYRAGSARMGATWHRYGAASGTEGEDWPRALAHELGHYLFYLYDNYLGLNDEGRVVGVESCTASLMTNAHVTNEYRAGSAWADACATTISARRNGRADWETITTFYPWLTANAQTGPLALPLAIPDIIEIEPDESVAEPLADFTFSLSDSYGASLQPGDYAEAVLYQDDAFIALGRPTVDKVIARGARRGDRLCVYELEAEPPRLGCETITEGDTVLMLVEQPTWAPEIIVSPISSRTVTIIVSATMGAGETLYARIYPEGGAATGAHALTSAGSDYHHTFELAEAAVAGDVQVWVDEPEGETDPRREAVTSYALGGSPECDLFCPPGGRCAQSAGGEIDNFIPAISSDGQVLLYGNVMFADGEFYALQKATRLPDPPAWATVVGDGYYLLASAGAPPLTEIASVNFRFRQQDVPAGEEDFLRLYFWDGTAWQELATERTRANEVAAASQGAGLYALMSTLEIPLHQAGWNLVAYPVQETRAVTEALASIEGAYGLVYGYDATDAADPWKLYQPPQPNGSIFWANDLETFTFGRGYWISATRAITWQIKGSESTRAPTIHEPPATYYGVISPTADFTPQAGMAITASAAGRACAFGQTRARDDEVVYVINVGYNPRGGTCGAAGETVTFTVGSRVMAQSAVWRNPRLWALNLHPPGTPLPPTRRVFLPVVVRGM